LKTSNVDRAQEQGSAGDQLLGQHIPRFRKLYSRKKETWQSAAEVVVVHSGVLIVAEGKKMVWLIECG